MRHKEREEHAKDGKKASKPIKDKLLGELCEEQRGLVEKIDQFHSRKLADRQKRLEEYIRLGELSFPSSQIDNLL